MKVLKIATAGNVDDGKSTLIGRLLYDTDSLTSDKIESIEKTSKKNGYDYLDFSLATDGLLAEREQGITIDVANIYFSTKNKNYIIADTPGHTEYTRNMVTGASNSHLAVILIDARKGVGEQTYRHYFISNLLRLKFIIVAVNKMDLVDFSFEKYNLIKTNFQKLIQKRDFQDQKIVFIPISSLNGDNVVKKSKYMNWYNGKTLLETLENYDIDYDSKQNNSRFPIQHVIRPKTNQFHDFRGYAGKVNGGSFSVGEEICVLPSLTKSKIKEIYFYNKKYNTAVNDSSVTITLEDDVNISRGDMIVKINCIPKIEKKLTAIICWMDSKYLQAGNKYILQHGVNKVFAIIDQIHHIIKPDYSGLEKNVSKLVMNDIALLSLRLNKSIFFDEFKKNKSNGSFILIDTNTNNTVGVGFIQ